MKRSFQIPLYIGLTLAFVINILAMSLVKVISHKTENTLSLSAYVWVFLYCILSIFLLISILIFLLKKADNSKFVCSILSITYGVFTLFSFVTISYLFGIPMAILGILFITIGSIYIHKNKENYY
ncbi:hypothetical protein [Spiroplasma turonicum]|uniref:Transporter n=1 Tax=Spiroplasma turonicum TaxID=216946 RepID=A0A0K1P5B2_9MOLU|nr:hypothetical protein [Spiroplasma turonicum]AKU79364.1 hypothetical protein STURON_00118 [Spiroplasma turonicum]ALX70385.1 hypothetical protein STURO_v1c01160 [Spiroplasma turonicum]